MHIRVKAISIEIGTGSPEKERGSTKGTHGFRWNYTQAGNAEKAPPSQGVYHGFPPSRPRLAGPDPDSESTFATGTSGESQYFDAAAFRGTGRECAAGKQGGKGLILMIVVPCALFFMLALYSMVKNEGPMAAGPRVSQDLSALPTAYAAMEDAAKYQADSDATHPGVLLVRENFRAINAKNFQHVYSIRARNIREKRDADFYRELYANNLSIEVTGAELGYSSKSQALVNIKLCSRDEYRNKMEKALYTGWFIVVKEDDRWKICDSHIRKVNDPGGFLAKSL
ncbi:MAG: hypothetical protein RDV48_27380 [Candidatus Eremiobacteraeota bacterium]|nr:hypothetical protein [Candidatus Eremiobacteraeota bacterium]